MASEGRPILITVHGIRTFGEWQERLKRLVRDANPSFDVKSYRYGYFSVIAFLLPIFRWLAVRSFRNRLREVIRENPGSPITIVCHSFGTHIVAHALAGMRPSELPPIPALILSGSVLRSNFNWSPLRATGKLRLVVNDCGINDEILILSQMFVLLTGMAGRIGFYGFTDDFVVNRYFAGGHSHYFAPVGDDQDSFMRKWWLPILAHAQAPTPAGALSAGGTLQGILHASLRIADPLKAGLYLGLIAVLVFFGYVQPRREAALEQGRREYQAAAGQVGNDKLVPGAVATLARLINEKTFTNERDKIRVADVARIGLQRMVPAHDVLATVPAGRIFRWSGGIYFNGSQPVRLDVPPPVVQFQHRDAGASVLVTERVVDSDPNDRQIELIVFDLQRGTELMRVPVSHSGRLNREFIAQSLRANSNRVLVQFGVREIEGDDSTSYYVGIDIARRTARTLDLRDDPDLQFHSSCNSLAWFDDEDDESKKTIAVAPLAYLFEDSPAKRMEPRAEDTWKSYSDVLSDECATSLDVIGTPSLQFPRSAPEQTLLRAVQTPTTEGATTDDFCVPNGTLGRDTRVVKDTTVLDLASMGLIDGTGSSLEQVKSAIEEMPCPQIFSGAGGKQYLATVTALGLWIGGHVLCELLEEKRIGRCGVYPFASEGGGSIWKSAAGDYVVLGDARTETNPGGFRVIELAGGKQLTPDDIPAGRIFAAAIDSARQALMVASDVEGFPGAAEVSAYRFESSKLTLIGRQTFEAPYDGVHGTKPDTADDKALQPKLLLNDGTFVLSMMPGTLIAFDVPQPLDWIDRLANSFSGLFAAPRVLPPASIPLRWSIQQLDLGGAVAEVTMRPGSRMLIARVGSRIRLFSTVDGEALTPSVDLARLDPNCGGKFLSATIEADESLTLALDGCRVQRAAPAAAERIPLLTPNLEPYFGLQRTDSNK